MIIFLTNLTSTLVTNIFFLYIYDFYNKLKLVYYSYFYFYLARR